MPSKSNLKPFPRERFLKFCSHARILTKDYGLIPFRLLGSQQYILDQICLGFEEGISEFLVLKNRQAGSSTFFLILDLFWMFEHPGMSGAIITHTEQLRDQFRNIVNTYLQFLPPAYKVPKENHNRSMLLLRNQSTWQYFVAGTKETSKGLLGTGGAFNFVHASEVSAYGSEEDLKNLSAALSTHHPHRLYVFESTARGFNHFADMWQRASESQTQRVIFVPWWRNELFRFDQDSIEYAAFWGDDPRPNALERKRMNAAAEQYGVEISPEQMAWYRWKLHSYAGDQAKMDEDFPWTPDDAFVSTGARFFSNSALTDQMRRARKQVCEGYRYDFGRDWRETKLLPCRPSHAELRVWEEADPLGRYVVSCDPAYGSSDEADRTAISVLRCYADRCVQVAEFCSSITSTYQCAWIVAHLCGYYRNVRLILEIQGPGQAVDGELQKLRNEAPNMFPADAAQLRNCLAGIQHFLYRRGDHFSGNVLKQFKTSREIKFRMMARLKDSVELDRITVNSIQALDEMNTIVYDSGSVGSERGKKDDRVIALGMGNFAWLEWEQPLLRQQGMTMLRAAELKERGATAQTDRLVLNYLEQSGMLQKQPGNVAVLPFGRNRG